VRAPHGWWIAAASIGVASLALGFGPDDATRVALYVRYAVPIALLGVAAATALAIACAVRRPRTALGARTWLGDFGALALVAALYVALLAQVKPEMRVQADESMLVGASLGIHLSGQPLVPLSGLFDAEHRLRPAAIAPDKRGALFPLLVAGVHAATGYRASNAIVLNSCAGLVCALLAYFGLRRNVGIAGALAGTLLVLALPSFFWSAASAGFEIANLLALLVLWHVAMIATEREDPWWALLLAVCGGLASQLRYESTLGGALAFAYAVLLLRRRAPGRAHWLLAATPLLFLPVAWQRAVPVQSDLHSIGATTAFGASMLVEHVANLGRYLAWPSLTRPAAPALLLLLGAGIAAWTLRVRRGPIAQANVFALACVGLSLLVVLAFAWGDVRAPIGLRLALPFFVACAILSGAWTSLLPSRAALPVGAAVSLAIVAWQAPVLKTEAMHTLLGISQNASLAWARGAAPGCRIVFVDRFPTYFVVNGQSALASDELAARWAEIRALAAASAIDGVWWVQPLNFAADPNVRVPDPPAGFAFETLASLQLMRSFRVEILAVDRPAEPLGRSCRPAATGSSERPR
jgi:hypothetical protein